MTLVIMIGASGSGKTTIAQAIAEMRPSTSVFYFDDIGVPSASEVVAEYGSPEAWQQTKTFVWMERLARISTKAPVLFEGQTRLSFLAEGARRTGNPPYSPILIDCDDSVRSTRLRARGQAELADASMMGWAEFLRQEALAQGCSVIDTSALTLADSVKQVLRTLDCA